MKLLAIFFAFTISCSSMAQSSLQQALSNLKQNGLINAFEDSLLQKEINARLQYQHQQAEIIYREQVDYNTPYEALSLLRQAKMFSTSGTLSAVQFSPAGREAREETDEEIHKEIREFVQRLSETDLVSKLTISEINNKNDSHEFTWPYQAAEYAYLKTNEEYFLQPKHFTRYITGLLNEEIIDKKGYDYLLSKSGSGNLLRYTDIYSALKKFVILNLEKMPTTESDFLQVLYSETSTVFPGLSYKTFSYKDVIDKRESFDDFIAHNLSVSLKAGDKTYSYSSYYYYDNPKKSEVENMDPTDFSKRKIPEQYYQVFNKIMVDNLSPYRLHMVSIDSNSFGIIALTEKQTKALNWMYDGILSNYINISYESFSKKLTTKKIADAITVYTEIGLFSHLTRQQIDDGIREVKTKELNFFSDILSSFDNIVYSIEAEYGIDSGQYKSITENLSKYSGYKFAPTDIVDGYSYENKNFEYGFKLNGKLYKTNLKQEDDWLDFGFWELIKMATNKPGITSRFYTLAQSDGLTVIYLSQKQYSTLKQKKLLEFAE